jgi:antirestriction protein ArdC
MARTREQKDTEQQITDQIIDLIENGMVGEKWERPWKLVGFLPYNALTGKQYSGINMLLGMIAGGGPFATYKQWLELGAQVQGGEKAAATMFRPLTIERKDGNGDPITRADGTSDTFMLFKAFGLFAARQQQGWETDNTRAVTFDNVEGAEQAIAATGASIAEGNSDRAFYSPLEDRIQLPGRDQFATAAGFYATALHELVHWTGHSSRLARDFSGRFGDDAYAFEELVAELGATFLSSHFGIEQEQDPNHAKYVSGWLRIMKGDKKAIRDAASQAQKAVDYILSAAQQEDAQQAA